MPEPRRGSTVDMVDRIKAATGEGGAFHITFAGPLASGKTVAMRVVEKALKEAGYQIDKSRETERGFEHTLSVRWTKEPK